MLEVVHQADHLIDIILQRSTGHKEDTVGVVAQMQHILGSLGFGVLDVVGLIDDDHVDIEIFFDHEVVLETFIVRYGDTAFFRPCVECGITVLVVKIICGKITLGFDLTAPVDDNAGRADNEETRRMLHFGEPGKIRIVLKWRN